VQKVIKARVRSNSELSYAPPSLAMDDIGPFFGGSLGERNYLADELPLLRSHQPSLIVACQHRPNGSKVLNRAGVPLPARKSNGEVAVG
jgi:hypothetical protein